LDKDVDDLFSLSQTEGEKYLAAAMLQVMENPALKTKYREASTLRVKEFSKEKKIAEWEQKISALVSGE
jgi:glycosyltransferase involved in cell wall biosynthesis